MFLSPFFFQNFGCHLYIPAFCDTTWVLSKKSYLPPLPNHLCINLAWPTSSDLEKTCQELETPPTPPPPPPPPPHTHTTHTYNTVYMYVCAHAYSHLSGKCLLVRKIETPPPPPPPHTHIHYTCSTHAYGTIQSSVRKMLACQENRDPPHTHTHIQYTCIQYYTVICQENACLSGK